MPILPIDYPDLRPLPDILAPPPSLIQSVVTVPNPMGLSAPHPECIFKGIDYYGRRSLYKKTSRTPKGQRLESDTKTFEIDGFCDFKLHPFHIGEPME